MIMLLFSQAGRWVRNHCFFIRSLSFLLATLLWLLLFLVKGVGFNLQGEPARVRGDHPGFAVAFGGPRPLTLVL